MPRLDTDGASGWTASPVPACSHRVCPQCSVTALPHGSLPPLPKLTILPCPLGVQALHPTGLSSRGNHGPSPEEAIEAERNFEIIQAALFPTLEPPAPCTHGETEAQEGTCPRSPRKPTC